MILAEGVSIRLDPAVRDFPSGALLGPLVEAKFEPKKSRKALEKTLAELKIPNGLIDPGAPERGGMIATEALLYPKTEDWELEFHFARKSPKGTVEPTESSRSAFPEASVGAVSDFLRSLARSDDAAEFKERWSPTFGAGFLDRIIEAAPAEAAAPSWPIIDRPGIYRREHASLAIRSRTSTVLIDPLSLSHLIPEYSKIFAPRNFGVDRFDAVLVSHGHEDHWSIPSIIHYSADDAVPVIVPRVGKVSIISPRDFRSALKLAKLPVKAPAWGSTVKIGDIEVDVLPFYGEQPTRDAPGPMDRLIRNWGNCYRVNTPDFSALVLIDSGEDPAGSMKEVVRESVRKRGPIDAVLSCTREFACPFFGGLSYYWLTLPFSRLQELFVLYDSGRLPITTAGIKGVAEICAAARARYFLPYAHGFSGLGRVIRDTGWDLGDPAEAAVLKKLGSELRRHRAKTKALAWNPGDAAVFKGKALAVRRYAPPRPIAQRSRRF